MTSLQIRAMIASPIVRSSTDRNVAPKRNFGAGLLQVLGNRRERRSAATVALVFFVGSLALAPALTRDQKRLAAEINDKTLKAAATIKSSSRVPLRVKH